MTDPTAPAPAPDGAGVAALTPEQATFAAFYKSATGMTPKMPESWDMQPEAVRADWKAATRAGITTADEQEETPGYWQVRSALTRTLNTLQIVALCNHEELAAMAKANLARVDAIMGGEPRGQGQPQSVGDSRLIEHARRELELCGQYAEDPEYAESIISAVAAFAAFGHSGGSAMIAREQLHALLAFKALSPLSSDPAEWIEQSPVSGSPLWQNRRDPSVFSEDGGKTWHSLEDQGGASVPPEPGSEADRLLHWAATLLAYSTPARGMDPAEWREGARKWRDAYAALTSGATCPPSVTCRDVDCTCEPDAPERCDYRLLADTVIGHLDVRHDDAAEVALCATAVEEAATGLPGALIAARAALRNIALGLAGDPSVAADQALMRMRELARTGASPDIRPRPGEPGWHDVTCGACGKEFITNGPIDDIACWECDARRCLRCGGWFGGGR